MKKPHFASMMADVIEIDACTSIENLHVFLERGSQEHQTSYQAQPVSWQWMNQQTAQLLGRY